MLVEILVFDVEYVDNCLFDFVQIYDGLPENSVMPEDSPRICGNLVGYTHGVSNGATAFIRFLTDGSNPAPEIGFELRISSIRKKYFLTIVPCVRKISISNLIG